MAGRYARSACFCRKNTTRWALFVLLSQMLAVAGVRAQPSQPAQWILVTEAREDVLDVTWPLDSLTTVAASAIRALQEAGHYFAQLDSVQVDSLHLPPRVQLFASPGPAVTVGTLQFEGNTVLEAAQLAQGFDTRPGQRLDPGVLDADLDALLARYESLGYPLAQVRLSGLHLLPGTPPQLALTFTIEEGATLQLARVELPGATRTRPAYIARLLGLRTGQPLSGFDPDALVRRLRETAFFSEVGPPELRLDPDSGAVLRLPVTEAPPGAFDLVLGYLPPARPGDSGNIVGNGHLALQHLFGGGRTLALTLNRLPGQVSRLEVDVADPFLGGTPLGAAVRFEGHQQDSTYGKQHYGAALRYRLAEGLHLSASVSRERTRPGQGGVVLQQGQQRIFQAAARFLGLGVRYQRLDRARNPRRGLVAETIFEQGQKERTGTVVAGTDTTRQRTQFRQERLTARVRVYVPTLRRQLVAFGGEAHLLRSDTYDRSDLFRFGGAASLRGYDEERFLGRFVARLLAEYRFQLDRLSYAYLFFDLGYVETPRLVDLEAARAFQPGYGLGMQFSTAVGLLNVSYALSPETGATSGKIHVGLSFAL